MPTALPEYFDVPVHRVAVWHFNGGGFSWEIINNLRCTSLIQSIQPNSGISRAAFEYDYGNISTDGAAFVDVDPLGTAGSAVPDILHKFIRIGVWDWVSETFEYVWAGIVTSIEDKSFSQPPADENYGTQQINASGLEYMLDRKQITTSKVYNHVDVATVDVNRALPFNVQEGRLSEGSALQHGNRRSGFRTFTTDLDNAEVWTAEDIARYLFDWHVPTRLQHDDTSPTITWTYTNTTVLSHFCPSLEAHGKSIYEILNELANPRRWLHYRIGYTANVLPTVFGSVNVHFDVSTSANISLPSGGSITGNSDTVTLQASGTIDGSISLAGDYQQKYKHVVVTGARKGYIVTTDVTSEFLEEGWTAAEQTTYEGGAEDQWDPGDWSNLDYVDQIQLNKNFRVNVYGQVFTRFVAAVDADFSTAFGITTEQYVPGLRWQRKMPLKKNWDYSLVTPAPKDGAPEQAEFRSIVAWYKIQENDSPRIEQWAANDTLATIMRKEGEPSPSSVSVRPLEDWFGLSIKPHVQPHWQATDELSGMSGNKDPELIERFDYKTDIKVTGYFRTDDYVTAQWPTTPAVDLTAADTIYIRLGDIAFEDLLLEDTVVDVDVASATLKTAPADILVRDDTDLMSDIARLAWQWYGVERYVYKVEYQQLLWDVYPGQIATNVDGASTDVMITDIAYDFSQARTSITTGFAKPDFTAIAREALAT